ncbi:MAG: lysophospholipid acyltransferase family protein [Thermoanaerobaculia bacterium]
MRHRGPLQRLKNWLIFRALCTLSGAGRRMSLPRARSIGRRFGSAAWYVVPKEREKALCHLAMAFPELDDAARESIARRMFAHLGTSLCEIAWLPNLSTANLHDLTLYEGLENFQAAVDAKKGVILFTGHCGNWEWMSSAIGLLGFDMRALARELYDPRLNDFVVASRAQHGVKTIGRGSTSSAREMLSTLRAGGILGALIDQNIKAEGTEVPFFGRPAFTPCGPATIAIRTGAAAIAGFIERRGDMQVLHFEPPLFTAKSDDPAELTAKMTAAIEAQIRRVPEQWVWMHDRWKVRKANEEFRI